MTGKKLSSVLIIYQTKRPEPYDLALQIADWLRSHGVDSLHAPLGKEKDTWNTPMDLILVLGGDGSMIRIARFAVQHRVPILGINFGRLGFLTEWSPTAWEQGLSQLVDGEYRIEERSVLSVQLAGAGILGPEYIAVNDLALTRGHQPRAIRAQLWVDEADLGEVITDGIVCATATGSTGYNLSNGGPILPPEFIGFTVTAIAPHLSWFHPFLLTSEYELRLAATSTGGVILTVDGQVDIPLNPEQHIHVRLAKTPAYFARTSPPDSFFASLRFRLARRS
ncbi:MAG: NAD(+)/NADH kinase [Chloroflexi bacterium]|nr:NAD(+)/NADH kinase [Chloroflexota bacterium]